MRFFCFTRTLPYYVEYHVVNVYDMRDRPCQRRLRRGFGLVLWDTGGLLEDRLKAWGNKKLRSRRRFPPPLARASWDGVPGGAG